MVIPAFLENKFAPLDFSSIAGYPNLVPSICEWYIYWPSFSGNIDRISYHHVEDFHECVEQLGISFEYVKMIFFMFSLREDTRLWYKTIPCGNISSLKRFHIEFNHFCKILYPPGSLFEDCCAHFNVENISKVNDLVEYACGAQIQ